MENNKQQTAMKLYTEEQVLNTAEAIRDYLKNYPEKFHESMIKKHLMNLAPITTKRTLIIYNTKETTEEEARHLLEILNCDDSTLWDNADHCGVQVIEVPLTYGGGDKQQTAVKLYTEEQVVRAIELSDGRSTDEVLAGLTPIKLPTNEELWLMSEQHALKCGLENIFDEDGITIIKHHWAEGYKKAVNDFLTYRGGNK